MKTDFDVRLCIRTCIQADKLTILFVTALTDCCITTINPLWMLLLTSFLPSVAASGPITANKTLLITIVTCLLLLTQPKSFGLDDTGIESLASSEDTSRLAPVERKRKVVNDIFRELGPTHQRRAHHMNDQAFWKLHRMLKPCMKGGKLRAVAGSSKKNIKNGAVNGIISSPAPLSCALRYFAGGDVVDISVVHGVGNTDVYNSVWFVVDAI